MGRAGRARVTARGRRQLARSRQQAGAWTPPPATCPWCCGTPRRRPAAACRCVLIWRRVSPPVHGTLLFGRRHRRPVPGAVVPRGGARLQRAGASSFGVVFLPQFMARSCLHAATADLSLVLWYPEEAPGCSVQVCTPPPPTCPWCCGTPRRRPAAACRCALVWR